MDSIFIIVVFTLNYKVNILVGKNTIFASKREGRANRLTFSSRYNDTIYPGYEIYTGWLNKFPVAACFTRQFLYVTGLKEIRLVIVA